MPLSARYSSDSVDDSSYDPLVLPTTPSYDSRTSVEPCGRRLSEYPAHGSVSSTPRPPQAFAQSDKRSSGSIVNRQSHSFFADDARDSAMGWTYNHAIYSYQPLGTYPFKQSECSIEAQASFTDGSSINNTRTYDLEEHHMDATYRVPQYSPPGYFEGLPACSDSHYDTKPYCDHHAASHCLMHAFSNQAIYDDQHSMPNSLHEAHGYSKDHTSLQHNHPHVPAELHLNISTASDQVQHVGMSISLRLSADHDPMIVDQGNDGSMGMPQRALHSERPPISSYSELSAHMSYYNGLSLESRQSKTPSLVTVPMDSKPLNNTSLIQRPNTPPPSSSPSSSSSSSKAQRPFEAWSPRQRKDVKNGDRPVKDEEDSSLPPTRRKRQSSPRSPTRSPSSESRRSRTLSPSSQSQGVLKTIMMKKGGSEPKKQNLACLFCRERKIACGRPAEGSLDPTCNQCLRRSLTCQYPTESRRGQHKRNSKKGSNTGHGSNRAK